MSDKNKKCCSGSSILIVFIAAVIATASAWTANQFLHLFLPLRNKLGKKQAFLAEFLVYSTD